MKFIYTCDIHGNNKKYEKLIELCNENDIKYLVIGGDLMPKRCDREVVQPIYCREFLDDYFSRLNENGISLLCILGNDDVELVDETFNEICSKHENVYNIDRKRIDIEDISFIGLSNILDNPFFRKDRVLNEVERINQSQLHEEIWVEKSSKKISSNEWFKYRERLPYMCDVLKELPKSEKKTVYVMHCPPYGIGLDECNHDFKAGSKDILSFIEKSNAYMSLHGHIHESYELTGVWNKMVNNTIVIQPGQYDLSVDKLVYVIIDTDKNKYIRKEINC